MTPKCVHPVVSSCITIPFGKLFTSARYVDEPLLTLTPLYSDCSFLARLACLNPAASVRSEPGSNSSKEDLSGSHMIEPRRTRSVSARSEDRVVLDGSICMDPEISPEGLIPFFSSPRLLRCQSHRFYPAFSALFSRHRGAFQPPVPRAGGAICEAPPTCQTTISECSFCAVKTALFASARRTLAALGEVAFQCIEEGGELGLVRGIERDQVLVCPPDDVHPLRR